MAAPSLLTRVSSLSIMNDMLRPMVEAPFAKGDVP